jgi:threonine aldolase
VNRLQTLAAALLGKEAALFVPSGTMANQIALRALTEPGDAAIAARDAHMVLYESGAAAALAGVQLVEIGLDGTFGPEDLRAAVYPADDHFPRTRALLLENTHNRSGGRVFPFALLQRVAEAARALGLRMHMDGARLFNAEAATGIPAARWAEPFDTVSFCLSKGLGAPVGSLVAARARSWRAHTASANSRAGACARRASSPLRASSRSSRTPSGSPTTTRSRACWRPASRRSRASSCRRRPRRTS